MKTFLFGVALLIIGALVGHFVLQYQSQNSERLRYLDVQKLPEENILKTPATLTTAIEYTVNKKPILGLSSIRIRIFNFTDRDYEKVPVTITLKSKNNDALSIISKRAVGEGDLETSIETVKESTDQPDKKYYKASYNVKILNRNTQLTPAFDVVYFVEGNEPPGVDSVQIDFKGVKTRDFEYKHYYEKYGATQIPYLLISLCILMLLIGVFLIWSFIRALKQRKTIDKELFGDLNAIFLKADSELVFRGIKVRERAVEGLFQHIREFYWNKRSWLDRRVLRRYAPDIADLRQGN